jgi:hypothetical protein
MQATQVLSNQDPGASGNIVAEVTKVLASADRSRLSYVAKKLKRLRASDAQPRVVTSRRLRPRRPGWVINAVVRVLANAGGPMRRQQIHAAVEQLLGQPVSKDSVDWCLSSGARRKEPRFERVSSGCYRLSRWGSASVTGLVLNQVLVRQQGFGACESGPEQAIGA